MTYRNMEYSVRNEAEEVAILGVIMTRTISTIKLMSNKRFPWATVQRIQKHNKLYSYKIQFV